MEFKLLVSVNKDDFDLSDSEIKALNDLGEYPNDIEPLLFYNLNLKFPYNICNSSRRVRIKRFEVKVLSDRFELTWDNEFVDVDVQAYQKVHLLRKIAEKQKG